MPEEKRESKFCKVCGDVALGYNFDAMTCESCKAFFRRNALKEKILKCHFKGCCEINAVTRRFCQSCRLYKCFSVGMKRELIMTDEDKERKRRKRALKRQIVAEGKKQFISKDVEGFKNNRAVQTELVCSDNDVSSTCKYFISSHSNGRGNSEKLSKKN